MNERKRFDALLFLVAGCSLCLVGIVFYKELPTLMLDTFLAFGITLTFTGVYKMPSQKE